jgi:DNA-binding transcriptional LysR family regulator
MRSLNLDQLRALEAVIELSSFTAAARRLNLSQSTISVQIRELEQRFGVMLIERMGKRAYATPPGRELVESARRIFRECQLAEDAIRRFRDGWEGRAHIATTNTALLYDLPPILRKLRFEHPGIDLHVTNMPTRDSVEHILDNKIDLALVTLPVERKHLQVTPLRRQTLVAIFPQGTRGLPDEITADYAARQSLLIEYARGAVHSLIMLWLSRHMPLARAPMHLGTIEALKMAVKLGLGMSIIPDVAVTEHTSDLIVRPLKPPVPCTLGLIEHRNKRTTPALQVVREAILDLKEGGSSSRRSRSADT